MKRFSGLAFSSPASQRSVETDPLLHVGVKNKDVGVLVRHGPQLVDILCRHLFDGHGTHNPTDSSC